MRKITNNFKVPAWKIARNDVVVLFQKVDVKLERRKKKYNLFYRVVSQKCLLYRNYFLLLSFGRAILTLYHVKKNLKVILIVCRKKKFSTEKITKQEQFHFDQARNMKRPYFFFGTKETFCVTIWYKRLICLLWIVCTWSVQNEVDTIIFKLK